MHLGKSSWVQRGCRVRLPVAAFSMMVVTSKKHVWKPKHSHSMVHATSSNSPSSPRRTRRVPDQHVPQPSESNVQAGMFVSCLLHGNCKHGRSHFCTAAWTLDLASMYSHGSNCPLVRSGKLIALCLESVLSSSAAP